MSENIYLYQAELLKALAHPARLQILDLLKDGEKCVCKIVPELQMEQSNVSRHLNVLKKEGLITSRKEGLKVFYKVNDPKIFELIEAGKALLKNYWNQKQKVLL
ncbi:MAG: metalloregulator ArsR/SmtB family transcription factor [Bacillota bacterium]